MDVDQEQIVILSNATPKAATPLDKKSEEFSEPTLTSAYSERIN